MRHLFKTQALRDAAAPVLVHGARVDVIRLVPQGGRGTGEPTDAEAWGQASDPHDVFLGVLELRPIRMACRHCDGGFVWWVEEADLARAQLEELCPNCAAAVLARTLETP